MPFHITFFYFIWKAIEIIKHTPASSAVFSTLETTVFMFWWSWWIIPKRRQKRPRADWRDFLDDLIKILCDIPAEDAVEDEEGSTCDVNPFALAAGGSTTEELFLDDPKKTLRGWFEREGYELEYHVEEKGPQQFLCKIELVSHISYSPSRWPLTSLFHYKQYY